MNEKFDFITKEAICEAIKHSIFNDTKVEFTQNDKLDKLSFMAKVGTYDVDNKYKQIILTSNNEVEVEFAKKYIIDSFARLYDFCKLEVLEELMKNHKNYDDVEFVQYNGNGFSQLYREVSFLMEEDKDTGCLRTIMCSVFKYKK